MADQRPTTDKTRLVRAQSGDMEAFAELFEPLRPLIYTVAYRLVGANDADDVVMETFLKAWDALPRFKGRSSLATWLCRIARNCSYDVLRAKQRRAGRAEALDDDAGEGRPLREELADPSAPNPENEADRRELGRLLDEAIAALDEPHRTTFLLREVDGLRYSEIAAATGVRIGTVMSRLFYARRKLQKYLEARGFVP